MTEAADDAAAASARAAEQARLRKERREAKIKAGGASRLNKITGLGGGIQRDPPPTAPQPSAPSPQPTSRPATSASDAHADPEEVDISQHYYAPQTTNRIPPPTPPMGGDISEDQLRQMMLGFDPAGPGAGGGGGFPGMGGMGGMPGMGGFPGMGGPPGAEGEDPMMKMLQQMMAGGGPGGPGGAAGSPFGLGSPFGGPATVVAPDRYSAIWRLLHTAVALGLGLYIALWTSFAGTKLQRVESSITGSIGRTRGDTDSVGMDAGEGKFDSTHFFWAFATAEAVLLTTRWWLDKGRAQTGGQGMLGMVVGFLPQPFKGWVELVIRYGQVLGTVRGDVLVCVFVLGVCAWLRG
ncbi:hypothetical protein GE09DRAFT_1207500 [Coniochaeta sp. 2T2.1]|nr:hypothetical protein GE09DRAFT_1207500 [Coniochaeta sp. 2T2.1]